MEPLAEKILATLRGEFESNPLLKALQDFAGTHSPPLYLVGGHLRDIALERPVQNTGPDVDCAVPKAEESARGFAEKTGGHLIRLDAANWRVIAGHQGPSGAPSGWVDFSDLRGHDIRKDLHARDFTINALACRLPDLDDLLDPENGIADCKARRVRAVSKNSFRDDPIRLLRAYRLGAQLNFSIDPETVSYLGRDAAFLEGQPGERLRAELFGILAEPTGGRTLRQMRDSGVLHVLFPECRRMEGVEQGGRHHTDVLTHSLDTVEALEGILKELPPDPLGKDPLGRSALDYLSPPHRHPVLKLAALLHDAGKPETKAAAERPPPGRPTSEEAFTFHGHERVGAEKALAIAKELRMSRRERESLLRLVSLHMRPGFLFWESGGDPKAVSPRALHRLARDAGEDLPGLALLAVADGFSQRGPLSNPQESAQIVGFAQGVLARVEASIYPVLQGKRLLTGHDLMESLGISEGPFLGTLLREVEEAHTAGEIKTKREALRLAEKLAKAGEGNTH
ncbi:MAG: HD domain-containing protein [Nitrospinota bacterium]